MVCNYSKGAPRVNTPVRSHSPQERADMGFSRRLNQITWSYAHAGPAFLLPSLHRKESLMQASQCCHHTHHSKTNRIPPAWPPPPGTCPAASRKGHAKRGTHEFPTPLLPLQNSKQAKSCSRGRVHKLLPHQVPAHSRSGSAAGVNQHCRRPHRCHQGA